MLYIRFKGGIYIEEIVTLDNRQVKLMYDRPLTMLEREQVLSEISKQIVHTIPSINNMQKLYGNVHFDSEPRGADIIVDGQILVNPDTEESIKTPATVSLLEGRRDFIIRLTGSEDATGYVDIIAGTTVNIFRNLNPGKPGGGEKPQPQIYLAAQNTGAWSETYATMRPVHHELIDLKLSTDGTVFFAQDGVFVVPNHIDTIYATLWGGGGGAGDSSTLGGGGGSGGGGSGEAIIDYPLSVKSGEQIHVHIGAGGTQGGGGTDGGPGENTIVTSSTTSLTAVGGHGGYMDYHGGGGGNGGSQCGTGGTGGRGHTNPTTNGSEGSMGVGTGICRYEKGGSGGGAGSNASNIPASYGGNFLSYKGGTPDTVAYDGGMGGGGAAGYYGNGGNATNGAAIDPIPNSGAGGAGSTRYNNAGNGASGGAIIKIKKKPLFCIPDALYQKLLKFMPNLQQCYY